MVVQIFLGGGGGGAVKQGHCGLCENGDWWITIRTLTEINNNIWLVWRKLTYEYEITRLTFISNLSTEYKIYKQNYII